MRMKRGCSNQNYLYVYLFKSVWLTVKSLNIEKILTSRQLFYRYKHQEKNFALRAVKHFILNDIVMFCSEHFMRSNIGEQTNNELFLKIVNILFVDYTNKKQSKKRVMQGKNWMLFEVVSFFGSTSWIWCCSNWMWIWKTLGGLARVLFRSSSVKFLIAIVVLSIVAIVVLLNSVSLIVFKSIAKNHTFYSVRLILEKAIFKL